MNKKKENYINKFDTYIGIFSYNLIFCTNMIKNQKLYFSFTIVLHIYYIHYVICIYIYIYISFIIYIFTYDNNKRIYYILVLLQIYYFEISDLNAFNAIRVCSYTV